MIKIDFLKNAELYHKYQKEDNIKKANFHAKKLYKIRQELINIDMYKEFLDNMMFYENKMAQLWACGISIDLDYRKLEAIEILKKLSYDKDEIICRSAKMSLCVRCNMPIETI